jgi:hypothetical protein
MNIFANKQKLFGAAAAFVMMFSIVAQPANAKTANAKLADGTYQITTAEENLALNKDADFEDKKDSDAQKWSVSSDEKGYLKITNVESNQVLTYKDKQLTLADDADSKAQKWQLKKTSDGYQIRSVYNSKYSLAENEKAELENAKGKAESFTFSETEKTQTWTGPVLSASAGSVEGPSGRETYYNLDMSGVVSAMQAAGIEGEYWVREDGVKMYGDYVMVAANYSIRPKGTLIETSLGTGIVCDTGGFASVNPTQLDIATNW